MESLRADVYVSSRLPIAIQRNGAQSTFSPISCTLIHGKDEAVLVDTPISISQTEDLVKWIEGIIGDKKLKYIYITHGHGDHWFGIPIIKRRWPDVKPIATSATVSEMKKHLTPPLFDGMWLKFFPDQISQPAILAEPMPESSFELEGHLFHAVEVGHTDSPETTVLHVPDLHLVVAGDVVYGDVHQYFGEADTTAKREEWLQALDTILKLEPHTVIAGHKRPGGVDGIFNVYSTKEYIIAFEKAVHSCTNSTELYQKMQELYPYRINPHAILAGATAAYRQPNL